MILTLGFMDLPRPVGAALARPVVDLVINGVEAAPVRCLLDTGAANSRLPASIAPQVGVELAAVEASPPIVVGGVRTVPHEVQVSLSCAGHAWTATVSFCDPDFAGFGLAGLRGFFDHIHCCVDGYLGSVELEPHEDRLHRMRLSSGGPFN